MAAGAAPFHADVAIRDGLITEVGRVAARGAQEIAADGLLVTPGFVDVHTHYDGQVTWQDRLTPFFKPWRYHRLDGQLRYRVCALPSS